MGPFILEISVIQPASASSSCSWHITIEGRAAEVVSDVRSRLLLKDQLCQSAASWILSIDIKYTTFQVRKMKLWNDSKVTRVAMNKLSEIMDIPFPLRSTHWLITRSNPSNLSHEPAQWPPVKVIPWKCETSKAGLIRKTCVINKGIFKLDIYTMTKQWPIYFFLKINPHLWNRKWWKFLERRKYKYIPETSSVLFGKCKESLRIML